MAASLASNLLDARRSRDWTQADLARAADVPLDGVRAAEEGDSVRAEVEVALRGCLGLTGAVAPVAAATGIVVVGVPERGVQADTVTRARESDPHARGWLCVPDVTAMEAQVRGSWRFGLPANRRVVVRGAVVTGLTSFAYVLGVGVVGAVSGHMPTPWGLLGGLGILVSLGSAATCEFAEEGRIPTSARHDPEARRKAYLVSPEGLSRFVSRDGKVERTDALASSIAVKSVRDEGPDHVTIGLRTPSGDVTMAWIPRDGDMLDVIAGWRRV